MPYLVQRNSANGHSHGFVSCVQQTSRLNKHLKEVVVCYVKLFLCILLLYVITIILITCTFYSTCVCMLAINCALALTQLH